MTQLVKVYLKTLPKDHHNPCTSMQAEDITIKDGVLYVLCEFDDTIYGFKMDNVIYWTMKDLDDGKKD